MSQVQDRRAGTIWLIVESARAAFTRVIDVKNKCQRKCVYVALYTVTGLCAGVAGSVRTFLEAVSVMKCALVDESACYRGNQFITVRSNDASPGAATAGGAQSVGVAREVGPGQRRPGPAAYHPRANFTRHTNRRKNSAEINRIIAKYSRPNSRTDERHASIQTSQTRKQVHSYQAPPVRPARQKKGSLKGSKSEDNLANMDSDVSYYPEIKPPPRYKYRTKSCEDITAFVDVNHSKKSTMYQENSILNSKTASQVRPVPLPRKQLHSICEDSMTEFKDSAIEIRSEDSFRTSTPISKRKTYSEGEFGTMSGFQKCVKYTSNVFTLRKGRSEPDILSASTSVESVGSSKTLDAKKRWKNLKSPFRKAAFSFLVPWKKKQREEVSDSR
ncbi:unnamed protein product [Plutella xylostella]|uniref:(diamondback moth) hypothetical protein n=1 Tax=Plutella xylostella TaxID=51655 RepID=A0A8S4FXC5_PLUXY|nr:unnamed protein product [Plutella xylostella]